MLKLFLLIFLFVVIDCGKQAAGVRGVLMCGNEPAANVKVKLYDDDSGPDLDDLMAEGATDSLGQFLLHGTASEVMTIDPKLNIYHDCEDGAPCQRKVSIHLPASYVTNGRSMWSRFNKSIITHRNKTNVRFNQRYTDYINESLWKQEFGGDSVIRSHHSE